MAAFQDNKKWLFVILCGYPHKNQRRSWIEKHLIHREWRRAKTI